MRILALVPLLLAPVPQPDSAAAGLSGKEKKQARAIVERCFAAESVEEREQILAELEPLDHPSKSDLKYFEKLCFKLAKKGPKQKETGRVRCTQPEFPGQYILKVPSKAKRGAKTGVFFSLHGGGQGSGEASQIQSLFGVPAPKLICVYPTVIQKTDGAWNKPREEQYVLAILAELKRTYTIDTNRVYVAGHSMGGFGTYSIGGRHADLFAAASSMAGGTWGQGIVPNFRNLPLYVYHSEDDARVPPTSDLRAKAEIEALQKDHGGFDYVFDLANGTGHGTPKDGPKPIFDWMLAKQRDPFPRKILWEPSREYKTSFYWLRGRGLRGRLFAQREGNAFDVEGGSGELWIYLNEENCDLSKPVTVRHEGREVHQDLVTPSLVVLVDSIATRHDPEMVFSARVRVR